MDLENFEIAEASLPEIDLSQTSNAADTLRYLDAHWYTETNRRGRWMDLIGDYAGSERFVLDGECDECPLKAFT